MMILRPVTLSVRAISIQVPAICRYHPPPPTLFRFFHLGTGRSVPLGENDRILQGRGTARFIQTRKSETVAALADLAAVVCLVTPDDFRAVGQFYETFDQVSDEEAMAVLAGEG